MAEPLTTAWPCEISLAQVDRGAVSLRLEPSAEQRKAIAKQLSLVSLEALSAEVHLSSWLDGASISGILRARVVQTCSATADDFETPIDARFSLKVLPANSQNAPQEEFGDLGADPDGDDPPDVLEGEMIDVSGYVVEHLALELDPFPRKPGAVFVQPPEPTEISPFSALKSLSLKREED
ncbi:YceD family protein [Caulobacter vibrioides]|uniref:DNA-binding protein n=2 Tax=Caulobacter vibrioides TaxID=155892 RepID=Q9A8I6_CAUVC|nr:DUF177 domain-containing protein [Caulobacter vibrioides]YP_002516803.1 hypothetical protein CCNA_01430 [Caulobacter vibrioides NA1000]AAK23348.1 hypothetical protein CC_1367 [Caulobacter vibrioides CB15]ACL94895.1 hypothetical protein CCNA_01430 [Caulobacter vibrioides NA1000]ATC28180.1 DUF177 domain-containing protein [Caulobacter vibrioides]QXZ53445.1 DUF177 domain-containing protein [Caulobacter vibrioides]